MSIIDVICNDLENNPECPHGPTLKFVRLRQDKQHTFFACSAYRDRKDCSFYLLEGEKITEGKKLAWSLEKEKVLPYINYQECKERLGRIKNSAVKERGYCHTCDVLVSQTEFVSHSGHNVQVGITDHLLAHPSRLFRPKDGAKQEAQYFFTANTVNLIVDNLQRLGVDRVLCLGVPRVHERVRETKGGMDSMLLDLDHRYYNFYEDKFCWFNMFNCHFLGRCSESAVKVLSRFISAARKVALVVDPPFGGRVEPLSYTIARLTAMCNKDSTTDVLVLWIYPYFMEPQVLSALPTYTMLDYKVAYDNHPEFQNNGRGRKHGSPVRIFSNVEQSMFPLPAEEGYRMCETCKRWVGAENYHCEHCDACTSKDGQTYVHCGECDKCVKPNWQHCAECGRCTLPDHACTLTATKNDASNEVQPRRKRARLYKKNKQQKRKFKSKNVFKSKNKIKL